MIFLLLILTLLLDILVFLFFGAYNRLSITRIFKLKESGDDHRERLSEFLERRNFFVSGFSVLFILFISATELLFVLLLNKSRKTFVEGFGWGFAVLLLTFIIASLFSAKNPENVFLRTLKCMKFLSLVFFPLLLPISLLVDSIKPPAQPEESRDEDIEAFLDEGQREGILEEDESDLIRGIMEFSGTVVREVMTPRIDVVTIEAEATLEKALELFAKCRHTRLPAYENQVDNIIGALWVKDILAPAISKDKEKKVKDFLRPVPFVPENKPISDLFKEFQEQREQMAIVVDEYGGVDGLVTTEDLVEEIVGEIEERGEAEGEFIKLVSDGVVEAKGRASLKDLSEILGAELPEGSYDSVAGWIATRLGNIPTNGQLFTLDGLKVEIIFADRKRIHKVRISNIKEAPEED